MGLTLQEQETTVNFTEERYNNIISFWGEHGSCCVKEEYYVNKDSHEECPITSQELNDNAIKRSRWIVDKDIPGIVTSVQYIRPIAQL